MRENAWQGHGYPPSGGGEIWRAIPSSSRLSFGRSLWASSGIDLTVPSFRADATPWSMVVNTSIVACARLVVDALAHQRN
jgi:hypothetical protein